MIILFLNNRINTIKYNVYIYVDRMKNLHFPKWMRLPCKLKHRHDIIIRVGILDRQCHYDIIHLLYLYYIYSRARVHRPSRRRVGCYNFLQSVKLVSLSATTVVAMFRLNPIYVRCILCRGITANNAVSPQVRYR